MDQALPFRFCILQVIKNWMVGTSLVPRLRVPPGEKRSGERIQISWAYYPNGVMTNEIARLVIIT